MNVIFHFQGSKWSVKKPPTFDNSAFFITNSRMSTGSCHIAIEEIPGGKGNDFGK